MGKALKMFKVHTLACVVTSISAAQIQQNRATLWGMA